MIPSAEEAWNLSTDNESYVNKKARETYLEFKKIIEELIRGRTKEGYELVIDFTSDEYKHFLDFKVDIEEELELKGYRVLSFGMDYSVIHWRKVDIKV